jgi:hypothetical protein
MTNAKKNYDFIMIIKKCNKLQFSSLSSNRVQKTINHFTIIKNNTPNYLSLLIFISIIFE